MSFVAIEILVAQRNVISFQIGISTPFAVVHVFGFERTTLRLSWVVFELENVAVHGKIAGKID